MGSFRSSCIPRARSRRRVLWSLTPLLLLSACDNQSDDPPAQLATVQLTPASSTQHPLSPSMTPSQPDAQVCIPGQKQRCIQDKLGQTLPFAVNDTEPLGNCNIGTRSCAPNGLWGACTGVIGPKPKDACHTPGDDANCNGVQNEGCSCVPPAQGWRACGSDTGACKSGKQYCINGAWGQCEGDIPPSPEQCDERYIDEDCDGQADRDDPDCACLDSDFQKCTIAGARGDCELGVKTCSNGRWTACEPRFPKLERESCAVPRMDPFGLAFGDEDCDGQVDNANGLVRPANCKIFILDSDNDGWGRMGSSFIEMKAKPTLRTVAYGCFCSKPDGYPELKESMHGRENRDCCETNETYYQSNLVHPGQSNYFTEGSSCLRDIGWKGGEFDYNCDNKEEKLFTKKLTGTCVQLSNKQCAWETREGTWQSDLIPACGAIGVVPTCHDHGPPDIPCRISDDRWSDSETQRCR